LGKKKEDTHHDDYKDVFLESIEKEIVEKKPPNEKILYFNLQEKKD